MHHWASLNTPPEGKAPGTCTGTLLSTTVHADVLHGLRRRLKRRARAGAQRSDNLGGA